MKLKAPLLYPPPFGVVKELSDTISGELIFLILRRGDENGIGWIL